MSEFSEEISRLNQTASDIRQAIQSYASSLRTGAQSPASSLGASGSGALASAAASGGGGNSSSAISALGNQLGKAVGGGTAGLGSFASSAASSGLGSGLAGGVVGSAIKLGIEAISDINQGGNAGIRSAPLFASSSFVDRAQAFGKERGFNKFVGSTLGLNNFTDAIVKDDRKIDEREEHEQAPVRRAAASVSDFARQIAEAGGSLSDDQISRLGDFQLRRARAGQDAVERATRIVTSLNGPTDPSANTLDVGR